MAWCNYIINKDNFIRITSLFLWTNLFLFLLLVLFFLNKYICTDMKSAAFFLNSSTVKILSYSSLSSKSSNVKREGWVVPVLWVWGADNIFGLESLLKVSTIETALCSTTARKMRRFESEIVLEPPISLTISRSHSIVSKILSIIPVIDLASFWLLLYFPSISLRLNSTDFKFYSKSLRNWSLSVD